MAKRGIFCASIALLAVVSAGVPSMAQQPLDAFKGITPPIPAKNRQPVPQKAKLTPFQERWNKAIGFHKAGKLDQAKAEYEAAIKIDPKWAAAYGNLAMISLQQNKVDEAIPLLTTASTLDAKNYRYPSQLAAIYAGKKRYDESVAQSRKALKLHPGDTEVLFGLGVTYIKMEKFSDAASSFNSVLARKPKDIPARQNLAFCYVQLKKYDLALPHLERLAATAPDALVFHRMAVDAAAKANKSDIVIKHLEAIYKAKPQETETILNLARLYEAKAQKVGKLTGNKKHDDAVTAEKKALNEKIKVLLTKASSLSKGNYSAVFDLGRYAFNDGEYSRAKILFTKADALAKGGDVSCRINIGLCNYMMRQYAEAEKSFRSAISLAEKTKAPVESQKMAYNSLLNVYEAQYTKNAESVALLREMAKKFPEKKPASNTGIQPESYTERIARILLFDRKYAEAINEYNTLGKDDPRAIQGIADVYLSQANEDPTKYDLAIAQWEKYAALKKDSIEPYLRIANIYRTQKKYKEAIEQFNKVLAKKPGDLEALNGLSSVYRLQEKYPDAIAQLRKVDEVMKAKKPTSKQPDPMPGTTIADSIADIMIQSGKFEDALKEYDSLPKDKANATVALQGKIKVYRAWNKVEDAAKLMQAAFDANKKDIELGLQLGQLYIDAKEYDKALAVYDQVLLAKKDNVQAKQGKVDVYKAQFNTEKAITELRKLPADLAIPGNPSPREQIVSLLITQKDYAQAAREYNHDLEKNPNDKVALQKVAQIYDNGKLFEEALVYWKKLAAADLKDSMARDRIISYYARKGSSADAITAFKEMLVANSEDNLTREKLAMIYERTFDWKNALAEYKILRVKNPGSEKHIVSVVRAYNGLNKSDAALAVLDEEIAKNSKNETLCANLYAVKGEVHIGLKQDEKAATAFKKALDIAPKNVRALTGLEKYYEDTKNYEAALPLMRTLLEVDDNTRNRVPAGVAKLLNSMGKVEEAADEFESLIKNRTAFAPILRLQYSKFLIENKRYDAALAQLKISEEGKSDLPNTYIMMGEVYEATGKKAEAMDVYKKCLAMSATSDTIAKLGRLYAAEKKGEWLDYLKSLIDSTKSNVPYMSLLSEYTNAGKAADGVAYLESLLKTRVNDKDLQSALAQGYSDAGQYDKAIEIYKKLGGADASDLYVASLLAETYQKAKKTDDAESIYKLMVKKSPSPDVHVTYADFLVAQNRNADALVEYKAALAADPYNAEAKAAVGRLEKK